MYVGKWAQNPALRKVEKHHRGNVTPRQGDNNVGLHVDPNSAIPCQHLKADTT